VPPVTTGLSGTATFHLVDNNQVLAFRLTLEDASQLFPAHIHMAAKGVNGPVVTDDLPFVHDGRRENLRWSCETSLRALGVESIGLYMLHAPDPNVPLAESVGALAELRAEGKIEMVGVSNLGRRHLAEAREIADVVAVENQLSPWSRAALPLVQLCTEQGIAFLAWSPLGGQLRAGRLAQTYPALAGIRDDHGVPPQQAALAWVLAQAPNVIPIPSARRPETIVDSLRAVDLRLSPPEIAAIDHDTEDQVTARRFE
jgi:aryl-alcohol dehydrogenase-like predicted oxidoreductase